MQIPHPYLLSVELMFYEDSWEKLEWQGMDRRCVCVCLSGWWFGTWLDYDFPIILECHHPKWRTPSFFRGVGIPPTSDAVFSLLFLVYHWCQGRIHFWDADPSRCQGGESSSGVFGATSGRGSSSSSSASAGSSPSYKWDKHSEHEGTS